MCDYLFPRTFTKDDLIKDLSEFMEIPKSQAALAINHTLDMILEHLYSGDSIRIHGFGTFKMELTEVMPLPDYRNKDVIRDEPVTYKFSFIPGQKIKMCCDQRQERIDLSTYGSCRTFKNYGPDW